MLQKLWKISFLMQHEFITEAYLENIQTSEMDTVQKIKFSIEDFFSKCDQIRRNLRIWSHLLKKSVMESFIFCALEIF